MVKITKAILKKREKKAIKRTKKEELEAWKLKVKERDNYTCQICKKYLKDNPHNCHAHHILDKKNYSQFKLDVNNGITLCYRDHKVGKLSPHLNALFFSDFLKLNFRDRYEYLQELLWKSQ